MSMDFFLGGGGEWYFWISEQDDISKSRWQGIFKLFVNNKPMGVQKRCKPSSDWQCQSQVPVTNTNIVWPLRYFFFSKAWKTNF